MRPQPILLGLCLLIPPLTKTSAQQTLDLVRGEGCAIFADHKNSATVFFDRTEKRILRSDVPADQLDHLQYSKLSSENLRTFRDGLGAVAINGKWGYMDQSGKVAIPAVYEDVLPFNEGFGWVKTAGKWGTISREGQLVIQPTYDESSLFHAGFAGVRTGTNGGRHQERQSNLGSSIRCRAAVP